MAFPLDIPELLFMTLEHLLPDPVTPRWNEIRFMRRLIRVSKAWKRIILSSRFEKALFIKPDDSPRYPDFKIDQQRYPATWRQFPAHVAHPGFIPGYVMHPLIARLWTWTLDADYCDVCVYEVQGIMTLDCKKLGFLTPFEKEMQISRPPMTALALSFQEDGEEMYERSEPLNGWIKNDTGLTLGRLKESIVDNCTDQHPNSVDSDGEFVEVTCDLSTAIYSVDPDESMDSIDHGNDSESDIANNNDHVSDEDDDDGIADDHDEAEGGEAEGDEADGDDADTDEAESADIVYLSDYGLV